MSRACSITGKKVLFGNNVSHSQRKTRRKYMPNIQHVTFISDILKCRIRLKVTTSTIRTIEKNGGLDNYLLKTSFRKLTEEALKLKRQMKKVLQKENH